jgi:hypothetical protein
MLTIADRTRDTRDLLVWRWREGEETEYPDLGDPLNTDAYDLCVYSEDGDTILFRATAPPGGTCPTQPCWKLGTEYRYKDTEMTPDGIRSIILRPGPAGRSRVVVRGQGVNLSLFDLSLAPPPFIVQLQATNGECWEAVFPPGVLRMP